MNENLVDILVTMFDVLVIKNDKILVKSLGE
jgi:hypothetical protein